MLSRSEFCACAAPEGSCIHTPPRKPLLLSLALTIARRAHGCLAPTPRLSRTVRTLTPRAEMRGLIHASLSLVGVVRAQDYCKISTVGGKQAWRDGRCTHKTAPHVATFTSSTHTTKPAFTPSHPPLTGTQARISISARFATRGCSTASTVTGTQSVRRLFAATCVPSLGNQLTHSPRPVVPASHRALLAFNMCTTTTGTDCSAQGFKALAGQSGSFGCAIISNWLPVVNPPDWSEITNGMQFGVQNGDAVRR